MEAMNGVTYLSEEYGTDLAIISFPGEYGQDGAQGAKKAAEALGLNIVYDGEGAVVPGADQTPVITELVNSGADIVWTSVNPTTLAEIMGGAAAQGFTAHWSGNAPSWGTNLLGTDLAEVFDQYWTYSTYTELWNSGESPGMQERRGGDAREAARRAARRRRLLRPRVDQRPDRHADPRGGDRERRPDPRWRHGGSQGGHRRPPGPRPRPDVGR